MLLKEVKTTRRRRRPLLDDPSSATAPTTAPTTTAAAGHEGLLPAAEDPFRPPLPGLDDDDDDGNGTPEQSAPPHPPPPLARPPYASAALAALADEYADCVGRGAWGQARACLERLPTGGDERPRALVEMAGALLGSLPARGWRLSVVEAGQQEGQGQGQMRQRRLRIAAHGGASTAPEKLEAEVLGPLCAAVLAAAWADEEEGMHEEAQQQHQQQQEPGAPLLLALRLEAATRREGAGAWATYAAARLVASRPGLASLHCCGLALGLAGSRSTTGGGGGATAPAPEGLDCMLGILALSLPGAIEVEATMRDLTSCAASSSLLPPWEVEEEEDGAYRVLPPALATRPRWVTGYFVERV